MFLSASLYVSKRGAYWDRLCRYVVGRRLSRACTVAKRCILGLQLPWNTNRNLEPLPQEFNGTNFDPPRVTPNRGMGPREALFVKLLWPLVILDVNTSLSSPAAAAAGGHTLFYECAKQLIVLASHHVTTQSWLRLIVLRLDVLPALRRWRWQVQMQIRWQLWRVRRYSHPLQVLSIWKMSSCRHATSRYVVQSCSFLPLNCKVATFTPASTAQSAIGNEQSKAGGQSSRLRGHTNAVHVQSELITQE